MGMVGAMAPSVAWAAAQAAPTRSRTTALSGGDRSPRSHLRHEVAEAMTRVKQGTLLTERHLRGAPPALPHPESVGVVRTGRDLVVVASKPFCGLLP